jgi:hypothetical protein
MSSKAAASATDKPPRPPTPRRASPEALAAARAVPDGLSWDDLVRIAHKPKRTGWVLWKKSGFVEQVMPIPAKKDVLLVRAWKSSIRHALTRHDQSYNCVELDPATKMPLKAP